MCKKILVTGGAGFIGSHVIEGLLKEYPDCKILIIDDYSTGTYKFTDPRITVFKQSIQKCLQKNLLHPYLKFDMVFHLAAQVNLRKAQEDPCHDLQSNLQEPLALLEWIVKKNKKMPHFIFSSSGGAIYGDTNFYSPNSCEEEHDNPINIYGLHKYTFEKYLSIYNENYGLPYTTLRYSNVYGPRQGLKGESGIIGLLHNNYKNEKVTTIFNQGSGIRDYVYVDDVVAANILVSKSEANNTMYNVSTKKGTSVDYVLHCIKELGIELKLEYKKEQIKETECSILSSKKIYSEYGWKPTIGIEEGLTTLFLH